MTYDEFKVVVAKVIEIEYDHWLKHGTPIRKEDAVLVADDVAGEVFIDSAVELARLRAEIDRLRGLLREWRSRHSDWGAPNDLERKTDAALASTNSAPVSSPLTSADQPSAAPYVNPECLNDGIPCASDGAGGCCACDKRFDGTADNGTEGHMEKRNAD